MESLLLFGDLHASGVETFPRVCDVLELMVKELVF
jgi:hypothetical protein